MWGRNSNIEGLYRISLLQYSQAIYWMWPSHSCWLICVFSFHNFYICPKKVFIVQSFTFHQRVLLVFIANPNSWAHNGYYFTPPFPLSVDSCTSTLPIANLQSSPKKSWLQSGNLNFKLLLWSHNFLFAKWRSASFSAKPNGLTFLTF